MSARWLWLFAAIALAPCVAADSPLILVSLDGFRWDYCDKYPAESANLRALKREGVAASLIPAFPSNTFPNHYTIVTGLYPASHGIVNNVFFDSESGTIFRYNQPTAVRDGRWWGGEPIWVTAIQQGRKAATSFWIGSEAPVRGVRPTHWKNYDYSIPFDTRLEELAGWLKVPASTRPVFVAFYLEETNSAGHTYGPDSPQVAAAVKLCDQRVAAVLARIRQDGLEPNLIVLSDHGMTAMSRERTVILDDHLDLRTVQIDDEGSVVALRPLDGDVDALLARVKEIPHARAYRSTELPVHFRFRASSRVAPVWLLPEEGWHVGSRVAFERLCRRYAAVNGYVSGDHGYDPALRNMHGIFIAHGPAFRRGVEVPAFENVHVYNLMCAVLGLKPAPNDGDDRLVKAALAR